MTLSEAKKIVKAKWPDAQAFPEGSGLYCVYYDDHSKYFTQWAYKSITSAWIAAAEAVLKEEAK